MPTVIQLATVAVNLERGDVYDGKTVANVKVNPVNVAITYTDGTHTSIERGIIAQIDRPVPTWGDHLASLEETMWAQMRTLDAEMAEANRGAAVERFHSHFDENTPEGIINAITLHAARQVEALEREVLLRALSVKIANGAHSPVETVIRFIAHLTNRLVNDVHMPSGKRAAIQSLIQTGGTLFWNVQEAVDMLEAAKSAAPADLGSVYGPKG